MTKKIANLKPRGGRRPGAGRKARPVHSSIFADMVKVVGDQITPLQIMLNVARAAYAAATATTGKLDLALAQQAHAWAKDAAGFVHPRMITHEVGGKGGGAIPLSLQASVAFYVPDNARRVAPPAASNDAVAEIAKKGNGEAKAA